MVRTSEPPSLAAAGRPARTESRISRSKNRLPGVRRLSGPASRKPWSLRRLARAETEEVDLSPSRPAMAEKLGRERCRVEVVPQLVQVLLIL